MDKNEEYAKNVLKDIQDQELDAAIILQTIKGTASTELELRESLLLKELIAVRTELIRIRKV